MKEGRTVVSAYKAEYVKVVGDDPDNRFASNCTSCTELGFPETTANEVTGCTTVLIINLSGIVVHVQEASIE